MSDPTINAVARVQITVEVACLQPWGSNATVAEVHEAAKREATEHVGRVIVTDARLRIIGEPRVLMVTSERVK